jgi:hypothetical protein
MIAAMKQDIETKYDNETLKAEIATLVAEIAKADSEHGANVVPRYWELGQKLACVSGRLPQKYALAKGKSQYYRARRINRHFFSLARARAYKGSLSDLLISLKKGIKGRRATPANEKAAMALIKAANGKVEEALLFLIQRHWELGEALAWLQEVEASMELSC